MSQQFHCHKHGMIQGRHYSCPMCRREQEKDKLAQGAIDASRAQAEATERAGLAQARAIEEAARQERQAIADAAWKENNPGDYDCPSCKLQSLLRRAKRCPKCRADIPDEYWAQVDAAEKKRIEEERRRQEEHERWLASPEYAAQKAAEEEAWRQAALTEKIKNLSIFTLILLVVSFVFCCNIFTALPALCMAIYIYVISEDKKAPFILLITSIAVAGYWLYRIKPMEN